MDNDDNRIISGGFMKKIILFLIVMLISPLGNATGFHYCTGKITTLITRATTEDSQVAIEGMNGRARLGYGGSSQIDMQKRQFSMLLSAQMAGKAVTLEFEDNSLTCSDNHLNMLIRFVQISN